MAFTAALRTRLPPNSLWPKSFNDDAESSGPYFQTWVERLLRRHNILAGQCQFADLDPERDIHKNGGAFRNS